MLYYMDVLPLVIISERLRILTWFDNSYLKNRNSPTIMRDYFGIFCSAMIPPMVLPLVNLLIMVTWL
jgi:hypothetical protein